MNTDTVFLLIWLGSLSFLFLGYITWAMFSQIRQEVSNILKSFKKLEEVDTEAVEKLSQTTIDLF